MSHLKVCAKALVMLSVFSGNLVVYTYVLAIFLRVCHRKNGDKELEAYFNCDFEQKFWTKLQFK